MSQILSTTGRFLLTTVKKGRGKRKNPQKYLKPYLGIYESETTKALKIEQFVADKKYFRLMEHLKKKKRNKKGDMEFVMLE